MNTATYRSVLRLLQTWPLDTSKAGGRDLGEFIRVQVANYFGITKANVANINDSAWEEICTRLTRISADHYKKAFSVSRIASSTGLSEQECHQAISNEGLKYIEEEFGSTSFIDRIKGTVKKEES